MPQVRILIQALLMPLRCCDVGGSNLREVEAACVHTQQHMVQAMEDGLEIRALQFGAFYGQVLIAVVDTVVFSPGSSLSQDARGGW